MVSIRTSGRLSPYKGEGVFLRKPTYGSGYVAENAYPCLQLVPHSDGECLQCTR